jgi:hypothetical protein
MESSRAVLLVPNREEWERRFSRYVKIRKRASTFIGALFGGPLLVGSLYLTGLLYPLLRGDIAPGHPSYDGYLAGTFAALMVVAASLVLYAGGNVMLGRWLRQTHVLLGFNPDGSFAEVRGVLASDTTSI